jgi:hypothetical protein
MQIQLRGWLAAVALVLGVALMPAGAADIDKYLPDDTEEVVTVNVKQILDSGLVKKFGLDNVKQALKDQEDVAKILKDLGFDPFADLDTVTVGSAGGDDPEKALIIVHGRFDLDKFKAKAAEAAKTNGEHLKIHKRDKGPEIYEVKHPDLEFNLFVSLPDKSTMLVSPGKDYVIDALKKIDNQKPTVKNAEIQKLIKAMDGKQSVSIAMLGTSLAKSSELANLIGKDVVDGIDAVGGGVTLGDDIKFELVVSTKTADAAKSIRKKIDDGVNNALIALAPLAKLQPDLQPAVDVVKAIKTAGKEKTVSLKGEVTAEQIEKIAKAIQGIFGS